jgi:hypothetical protein
MQPSQLKPLIKQQQLQKVQVQPSGESYATAGKTNLE